MSGARLVCGYLPLVDCAPLAVARDLGFASDEGLDLILAPEPSWSALRDKLAMGAVDAAHMLAPAAVAMAMGLGGVPARVEILSLLSVNGNAIGVSLDLAARLRAAGFEPDFCDPRAAGEAFARVAAGGRTIRIGAPFPFSTHVELLRYWLDACGASPSSDGPIRIETVPPPRMVAALEADEIDAFCVGEPWGGLAVERGLAELILPGAAIWAFAPEKALTLRPDLSSEDPERIRMLLRAVWRSARWLARDANRSTAAELLVANGYVDAPVEVIERALLGRPMVAPNGRTRRAPNFVEFHRAAATFPWRSQSAWIADRLAARHGVDRSAARAAARAATRADLHRAILRPLGADLPAASEKVEGALTARTPVASARGELFLGPDAFFDGRVFDPLAWSGDEPPNE